MKKALFVFSIFFIGLNSCKKPSNFLHEENKLLSNSVNSINPYNYIGENHNFVLYNLGNLSNFDSVNNEQIYYLIKQYCSSIYNSYFGNSYSDVSDEISKAQSSIDSFYNWTIRFGDLGYYDDSTKNIVIDIYRIITDSSINFLDTNLVYLEMIKIENRIIEHFGYPQNTNLDNRIFDFDVNDDKATYLLIGCAIAKYSFAFWADAYYNTTPWSDQLQTTGLFGRIGQWFGRAAADVGGFFSNPDHGPADDDIGFGHKWSWNIWDAIENAKTASANKRIKQNGGVTE